MLETAEEIRGAYKDGSVAAQYVERRFASELMALLHDRQVEAVHRAFVAHAPSETLEIAPGPGRLTRHMRPAGTLTCVEFNESMIDQAMATPASAARWVRGDAFALPFDECFDLIYTFRFIRHFRRADRDRLYAQIRRVLRPGGRLIMDAVNRRVSEPLRRASPDAYPIYDKLYSGTDEIQRELEDAGFVLESAVGVQQWVAAQSRVQVLVGPRSRWLCRGLIRGLEKCRRSRPLEWIVTCRRA